MQLPGSLLYFGVVEQKQKSWHASANAGLAILAFINLFSYLDRFVVAGVLESLKHSDLGLSDTNLGSLMTGFLIVYTLLAPVFGALGDRRSRPRLIAIGVACWSFATALSGFAVNFLTLFVARAAVGVGEAAYVTIAPSLLSDYFPVRQRGRVMAIFFCAIPVGSALGYVVGGLVDKHYGWRAAFFVAGVPGLLLAALCLGQFGSQRLDFPGDHQGRQPAQRAHGTLQRHRIGVLGLLGRGAAVPTGGMPVRQGGTFRHAQC